MCMFFCILTACGSSQNLLDAEADYAAAGCIVSLRIQAGKECACA